MKTQPRLRCAALLVLAALAATGLAACSSQASEGSVSVLAPWIGTERGTEGHAFRTVLRKFSDETGIRVDYQDTRALPQVLLSNVQAGTPPDIAILASPGELAKYARNGQLFPLGDDVIDSDQRAAFRQSWLLPQTKDGVEHIYTVPVKANLKGIVWFNPAWAPGPKPRTWDELMAYSQSIADTGATPWCMGMGDAPSSGWPGTDFIEAIFLRRFGPDLYREWAAGKLPWASNQVREAWTTWGRIPANFVRGGPRAAMLTDFGDAGRAMFTDPPGCFLEHQSSFIMGFYQGHEDLPGGAPRPGTDFDFFPFLAPGDQDAGTVWEASADLAGMFNDTPQVRQLMRFLATDGAQRIWPAIPGSSAFAVNKNVGPEIYHDDVSKRIADIFRSAESLCFDAADLMPATMRNAFYRAVLEYLNDPSRLDALLRELDQVRSGIAPEDWLELPCG